MPNVAVANGVRVPYEMAGVGPGLVLEHGTGPGGGRAFGHLLDRLGGSFHAVMPDLSGSPRVDDGGVALTVELLAGQVLAVAEAAGLKDFIVLGFSGFSPAHLALLAPEAVEALVPNLAPAPDLMPQIVLGAGIDVTAYAAQVAAPTLVIAGEHGATIPLHAVSRLARALPGRRTATLDSGHVMMFEKPEAVIRLVTDFVAAARNGSVPGARSVAATDHRHGAVVGAPGLASTAAGLQTGKRQAASDKQHIGSLPVGVPRGQMGP